MTAALELLALGLAVSVVDDQPAPGGRIFASIETRSPHGAEERAGSSLVSRFRESGGLYLSRTEAWQIEPGPRVFMTREGVATMVEPRFIILATGAQERPMPFTGWQLPGVMTVGAAQILLKTARQIPDEPVWLAGSGPLLLLYARQLLRAGGTIAGFLDTTPAGRVAAAAPHLLGALAYGWRDLARGAAWLARMRGARTVRGVTSIEALGEEQLRSVRYVGEGGSGEIETRLLFVHNGVVPGLHGTVAAGCSHRWNEQQRCFEPIVDAFGGSTVPEIFIAGDGATILGARAAVTSGRLAALGVARRAGRLSDDGAERRAAPLRRELAGAGRFRSLVDALYPPIDLRLPDDALLCRCEEVTAGAVRATLRSRPQLGVDGVKIATRAGMGPCQGRQCGLSLVRLVSEVHGLPAAEVGFLRIRPPLKPLTIGELASLDVAS